MPKGNEGSPAPWAPKKLVALYQKLAAPSCGNNVTTTQKISTLGRRLREQELLLLNKLISDERMRKVWQALQILVEQHVPDGESTYDYDINLFWVCWSACAEWLGQSNETSAEKRATLQAISKNAVGLANKIQRSKYFNCWTIERFMDDTQILSLAEAAESNPQSVKRDGGNLSASDEQTLTIYFRAMLSQFSPEVPALLESLGEAAARMALLPQFAKQAASGRAQAHFMARELSGYFRRIYKQKLHEQVAAIANVITGSELTGASVRELTG